MILIAMICIFLPASSTKAGEGDPPVRGRTDPSQYKDVPKCHSGAGTVQYMELLSGDDFKSNLLFIHRGIIPPGASIGEHTHIGAEEMYFVFNAPAEFTVNGRTAILPAGSCVLCPEGSSHGIYNPGDVPLEWMNIAVGKTKDHGRAINLGKDLTKQPLDSPAPFKWSYFDKSLLRPVGPAHLGAGKILNRRPWVDGNFSTTFKRIGHCVLPPGTSIGYHQHNAIEEVYYVMSGTGLMTVNDKTWEVGPGDAAACTLGDSHGIYNNTDEDLDIFVLQVDVEDIGKTNNWGDDLSTRKPNRGNAP